MRNECEERNTSESKVIGLTLYSQIASRLKRKTMTMSSFNIQLSHRGKYSVRYMSLVLCKSPVIHVDNRTAFCSMLHTVLFYFQRFMELYSGILWINHIPTKHHHIYHTNRSLLIIERINNLYVRFAEARHLTYHLPIAEPVWRRVALDEFRPHESFFETSN